MKVAVAAGIALIVVAALQVPRGGDTLFAAMAGVEVRSDSFAPADVEIESGDTVMWTWVDPATHTVTFVGASLEGSGFRSGDGETFAATFQAAGTFAYYCELHGTAEGAGMAGTVTVVGLATNTPAATSTAVATATRTVTRTPTRTATATATATGTPLPGATIPPPEPTTPTAAVAQATPTRVSAVRGVIIGPDTGSGPLATSPADSSARSASVTLATAGAAMLIVAGLGGRRGQRRPHTA